ncbi:FCD domain-containing protein [Nakamurella sp. YIM 132087]|uniref:FCD domain-containing protein n=1 Tax=Nakamurella alba TaxID=2665158 RepID=A0A7K1FQS1_9ACTN|nr:GntR family transcriptional regulator [Nakamurella alba]MTD15593.1 FCD domain-containing protein [Nakamurella alba]
MGTPRRRSGLVGQLGALAPEERRPGSSQEDILHALRTTILGGGSPPGAPIPVDEVAELFQVSRIPVREALKTLIGEGLVAHRARSGYTVAQLTIEEFQEIYVVRGVLERAAIIAAVVAAGPADDLEQQTAHDALGAAVAAGDLQAYHRESRRFHSSLLAPSRMPRLLHMIDAAWNLTEPCRPMAHISEVARERLHDDHGDMLTAFRARDTVALLAAVDAHQEHLEASIATLPRHTGLFAETAPTPVRLPAQAARRSVVGPGAAQFAVPGGAR